MNDVFTAVNDLFAVAVDISNFLWNFPTQFAWFSSIPVIGQFTLPVFLLVGIGVYFSIRTRFVQLRFFTRGVKVLFKKKAEEHTGISPMASFMLSTAMRVGAGNIVGVTGDVYKRQAPKCYFITYLIVTNRFNGNTSFNISLSV